MSLSSIIHDQEAIRNGLRARVVKPPIKFDAIKAVPRTTNYRIVGTAFDYLLRFFLERINRRKVQSPRWVAEAGVERIGSSSYAYDLDRNVLSHKSDPKHRMAEKCLSEARHEHQAYLKTGLVTDSLLSTALRLAYLDVAYRASPEHVDWKSLKSLDANDIADLRGLLALINKSSFRATNVCLLNPRFGVASKLVGGADADLLLDDCLIDIKTTKNPHLDVRDFLQLVGYYLLHGFDGIECGEPKTKMHEVNWLAIYFSRYGYLWKVPVNEVLPPDSVRDTAKWFFESVCTSKSQRLKYLPTLRGPLAKHLGGQSRSAKHTPKSRKVDKSTRDLG